MSYPRMSSLKTAAALRGRLAELGIDLPFDETVTPGPDAPLAQPYVRPGGRIGNRFAILPMEGWDGTPDDLRIGRQLTHSGRFARPNEHRRPEPRILYRHPYLDDSVGVCDDRPLFTDDEIARLTDDFIRAARLAQQAGFAFVDIKHC